MKTIGLAAAAALALAFFGAIQTTATVHASEAWETPCGERSGEALWSEIQFMQKPADSNLSYGEWFTAKNRVQTQLYFIKTNTAVYQQGADVCTLGEAEIAEGLAFILELEFLQLDPRFHHSPYQCNDGEESFLFYNNLGGIHGNSGGLFSEWTDGCSWDSDSYVNPFDTIEAETEQTATDLWNKYFSHLSVPEVISQEDFDAVVNKRYVDPTVEPCTVSNSVYSACDQMDVFN